MSLIEQGVDFVREMDKWRRAGLPIVTEEQRAERWEGNCQVCDQILPSGRCNQCGCFMRAKTWLGTSQCPLPTPKWLATVTLEQAIRSPWMFGNEDQVLALRLELASWLGTPFWSKTAGQAVCGVKADCVSFVESVMVNVGAMQPIQWPDYVTHTGGEAMRDLLMRSLIGVPKLDLVWGPGYSTEIMEGDILAGSSGRAHHHVAIAGEGDSVWHCTEQDGVCKGTRSDPMLSKYLMAVFRFKA